MKAISLRISTLAVQSCLAAMMVLLCFSAGRAQSQVSAADLSGTVIDQAGAVIPNATVTAKDGATGITRTAVSNEAGEYKFVALPPSEYVITAEAAGFKKAVLPPIRLTVGQAAELTITLEPGSTEIIVNVPSSSVALVETTSTTVANTISEERIDSLPINERSATGFALTLSTVGRDNGRPIGPAPTSGINVGGQRGRSTQVNVDGADFTDNSINAARTTVSQEAVQEYQVSTNSYTAEFGRATGGVVNVVTKRGTNNYTGNIFGFIRDKSIQARNPFAPFKTAFTRTQFGGTLGGPLPFLNFGEGGPVWTNGKDKNFFFASFERRQRNESGFFTTNVRQGLTGAVTFGGQTFSNITPQQQAAAQALINTGNPTAINAAVGYLYLASGGGSTALSGINPLVAPPCTNPPTNFCNPTPQTPFTIGSRFFLSGAPIILGLTNPAGQPIGFRPLLSLQTVFPVTDRTNYFSIRTDHNINERNQLNLRFGFNNSDLTGIQDESQNQSLGQNDFSRTGVTEITDYSFTVNLTTTGGTNLVNDFRFQFGKRDTIFRSQNNDAASFNISGTAFIGRNPFSPVDRTETRYQIADSLTWVLGNHTFKFGADMNFINIPRATFELNFAGLFNFGPTSAANLNAAFGPLGLPDLTPIQSYGLGLPSIFIQGFGNPESKIKNKPFALFAQDTWKLTNRFTINYGLRYDVEFTDTITPVAFRDPLTGITLSSNDILAAQNAVGVQQGIPLDTNNFGPRFGFAYDIFGNGKTVVRGAIGLFYDHPLLAVAFNSDIADAAQQQQSVLTAGSPAPTALFNASQVFQGTVCGVVGSNPAICGAIRTPGVAASAQYQFGRQRFNDQTFTGFGAVLPFSLPIARDFQYASATQANLTFERQLTRDMSLSVGYIFVGAHHLPHPTDFNVPNTALQIENYRRCFGALPTTTQAVSTVNPATCTAPGTWVNIIPGMISLNTTTGQGVIAPAVANFFRPNAPNYFLAQALSNGAVTPTALNNALAASNTLRTPGVVSPFGTVNAQASDGNSSYNAMNIELKRRFANNFTFLASYTWAHSIDDSSDLQTLLAPQDAANLRAERADSLFDQRHRFVFSGVLSSPVEWRTGSAWKKFFADFSIAPILEISSGRPFNILTNVDTNNDQSTQTDRPSVNPDGSLCIPGALGCSTGLITNGRFSSGNLGRNSGITGSYASLDLRVARQIRFGERVRLELIAEGFNIFNRFNEASASPFLQDVNLRNERSGNGRYFSRSTAAYDQRQLQFGFKLNF